MNRAWTKLGLLLFRVVNPVVMFVLFYATIVPIGLVMRALGRDPLRLRFDRGARATGSSANRRGPRPSSMKNQF